MILAGLACNALHETTYSVLRFCGSWLIILGLLSELYLGRQNEYTRFVMTVI